MQLCRYLLVFLSFKYEMAKEEPKERILTEQEIRRLIENSEAPLRQIILVALNTGMRKAEIHNLEWVNFNQEHNFIIVTAQEAKNKKIRRIAINKSLRELLLKLNLTRNGNRYVFENPKTGKPYKVYYSPQSTRSTQRVFLFFIIKIFYSATSALSAVKKILCQKMARFYFQVTLLPLINHRKMQVSSKSFIVLRIP